MLPEMKGKFTIWNMIASRLSYTLPKQKSIQNFEKTHVQGVLKNCENPWGAHKTAFLNILLNVQVVGTYLLDFL